MLLGVGVELILDHVSAVTVEGISSDIVEYYGKSLVSVLEPA